MFRKSILALGLVAVCLGMPAYAFQEQKIGGQQAPVAPAADAPAAGQTVPADMKLSPAEAPKPSTGTEVRIPGLGKLGVLPKMDFGLELLYGANEPKTQVIEDEQQPDDLTIRGTVKHKF
jgi:hypothetical protein